MKAPSTSELNPVTLLNHFKELTTSKTEILKHSEVLEKLIENITPVDFKILVFPHIEALIKQICELEQDIRNPDGSYKATSPELTMNMAKLKDLSEELAKLRVKEKDTLVIIVREVISKARYFNFGLCKNKLFIYLYNGEFWSSLEKEVLEKFLSTAAKQMGISEINAEFYEFAAKLFKQFVFSGYLPTPEPPQDVILVNLKNGTYRITSTGVSLQPFNSNDFLTYQLPFEFDAEAKAPLFQAYLNKVLPDPASQLVLAEFLGYVFTDLKLEKALVLYGSGANGKSVFFEIVNALLGKENITYSSLQSLTNENGYSRSTIANKLVNYASEINGKLETSIFKQLVSGEPVEARLPFGDPVTITKYAKLIFNCNELPKEVEHKEGYFRRFLIIPFDVTIPESEQDKELHKKIIASELSGVFNWVLEGLRRILDQKKFTHCEAAAKARFNYEQDSDTVRLFIDENRYVPSECRISIKSLYEVYTDFCSTDGFKPLNKTNFIKRLETAGITVKKMNTGKQALMQVSTIIEVDEPVIQLSRTTNDEDEELPF